MKSFTSNYLSALAKNSSTIATIIRIRRKDTTEYTFTDHDKPINVGGITYSPANSFSPSQFQASSSLSVDNLDITGIISEIDGITEKDIYSQFFYDAEIWVSQVDYTAPGDGQDKIMYGSLGETLLQENKYMVEFRSLTHILTRKVADVFSKTCRVELGSTKCGVILEPSNWVDQTEYCLGDYVSPQFYTGRRYVVTTPGISNSPLPSSNYVTYIKNDANIVSNWSLEEDPYYTEVKLLSHMDGTDTSTTFIDETGKTMTAGGNAQLKTGDKQFGTASAYFDGTGDYVQIPTSADWDWTTTTTAFTAEAWIKVSSFQDWRAIFGWYSNGLLDGWRLLVGANGTFHLATDSGGLGGFYITNAITLNTWHHVAMVVRDDQVPLAFVDGELIGTGVAVSFTPPTVAFCIGANDTGGTFPFHGYIDEVRITKGVARYTANFTPPSVAFESEGPTNVVDGSGSNTGTYINTPTLHTPTLLQDGAGSGYAVTFDKSNTEYISVPAAASINNFFAGGARTLEVWIKPTSAIGNGADHAWVIGKDEATGTYGTTRTGWALQYPGGVGYQYIQFLQRFDDGISTVSNTYARTPIGSVLPDSVYHVVVTYDGSSPANTMEIWLNGVKQTLTIEGQATVGHTASDDSGAVLTIGNCDPTATTTRLWDGVIDEVSMYNVKLSDAEIVTHYNIAMNYRDPDWNNTIDGTTNDGTIVWTTKDSLVKENKVITPPDWRLNIIDGQGTASSFGVEEWRFFDTNGTRIYPNNCGNDAGTYLNAGCDKLSDDTVGAWTYPAPVSNKKAWFTFNSDFDFSSLQIDLDSASYIVSFDIEVSYDGQTTWDTVYEFRNGTYIYWNQLGSNQLQLLKTELQLLNRMIVYTDGNIFTDMSYVIDGVLTWTSGENIGLSMEITGYNSTTKQMQLFNPMPYPIAMGDTYSVLAGCNHLFIGSDGTTATGHCVSRYNNGVNFRGEPFVPTEDVLVGGIGETNKEGYVD